MTPLPLPSSGRTIAYLLNLNSRYPKPPSTPSLPLQVGRCLSPHTRARALSSSLTSGCGLNPPHPYNGSTLPSAVSPFSAPLSAAQNPPPLPRRPCVPSAVQHDSKPSPSASSDLCARLSFKGRRPAQLPCRTSMTSQHTFPLVGVPAALPSLQQQTAVNSSPLHSCITALRS